MIGSNKILTVSYGTFSCTLEGFDDSFSTMKAIAEYFRDLAADDRYFGAEPPTPDADMLARIAEKEILRRVEARTNGKDIVLRASDDAADTLSDKPSQSTQEAQPIPAQVAADQSENLPTQSIESDAVSLPKNETNGSETEHSNSVSAKLARIKAVVDQERLYMHPTDNNGYVNVDWDHSSVSPPEALTKDNLTTDHDGSEGYEDEGPEGVGDTPDNSGDSSDATHEHNIEHYAHDTDDVSATDVDDAVAHSDEEHASESNAEDTSGHSDGGEYETHAESHHHEDNHHEEDDHSESEHVEHNEERPDQDAEDGHHDATDDMSAANDDNSVNHADEEHASQSNAEDTSGHSDGSEHEAHAENHHQPEEDDHSESEHVEHNEERSDQSVENGHHDATGDMSAANDDNPVDHADEEHNSESNAVDTSDHNDGSEHEAHVESTHGEDNHDKMPEETQRVPRVIRLQSAASPAPNSPEVQSQDVEHRDENSHDQNGIEAAVEASVSSEAEQNAEDAGDVEYYDEDYSVAALDGVDELTEHLEGHDHSDFAQPLQPMDEAELQEELADVERDIAQTPIPKRVLPEANDEMVSRISTQTNKELDENEGSERRSTFAHLKAAVTATKAALKFGEPAEGPAKQETPFRDDLERAVTSPQPSKPHVDDSIEDLNTDADDELIHEAKELHQADMNKQVASDHKEPSIVRPRRPVRTPASPTRPRSEPFKLVESQRIDVPQTEKGHVNVLPRRVTRTPNASAPSSGFAQFAEHSGARELPDLLEAAAAYVSFVEGADNFSRPQIMRQVQDVSEEEFSREEGLRHFGTLLREGRISKSQNGRFEVSKDTRFKPELHAS